MEPTEQPRPDSTLDEILNADEDGYSLALHDVADISAALQEQTERAYAAATNEEESQFESELAAQPGLFDLGGPVLADTLYIEGVLNVARGYDPSSSSAWRRPSTVTTHSLYSSPNEPLPPPGPAKTDGRPLKRSPYSRLNSKPFEVDLPWESRSA